MRSDEAKYHSDRALAEIDLASRAPCLHAARSHLCLSALHLDRLRRLAALPEPAAELAPTP